MVTGPRKPINDAETDDHLERVADAKDITARQVVDSCRNERLLVGAACIRYVNQAVARNRVGRAICTQELKFLEVITVVVGYAIEIGVGSRVVVETENEGIARGVSPGAGC